MLGGKVGFALQFAGACTFAATADWVRNLDPPDWAKLGFTDGLPVPTTLWRLPVRVDDTALPESNLVLVLTTEVNRLKKQLRQESQA